MLLECRNNKHRNECSLWKLVNCRNLSLTQDWVGEVNIGLECKEPAMWKSTQNVKNNMGYEMHIKCGYECRQDNGQESHDPQ